MTYLKIVLQGMIIAIYSFCPINTYSICHKQLTCQHIKQKEWSNAVIAARKSGHKFLYNIALTQKFLNSVDDSNIKFESITAFLQDNPHYPMRNNIIKIAEKSINNNTNPESIVKWFQYNIPLTAYGYYHYALAAYDLMNESSEMYQVAYNSWMNCDTVHIRLFLDQFANLLDDKDYYRKIQLLIIEKNIDDARSLMSISRHRKLDWQSLNFMIHAVNGDSNTKELFSKLSDTQRKDLAVIYSMLSYGVKKKICHEIDAVSLFALATLAEEQQVDHFITTSQLIQLRTRYARELIAKKQFDAAYNIVSDVALNSKHNSSIDAQWLAGWIALRISNDPQLAIVHFNNILSFCTGDLEDNTQQLSRYRLRDYNTLSKCYYWLGRAYKDQQETEIAEKYFKEAARYQYDIYGQLAIMEMQERLVLTPEPQIQANNVYLKDNDYAAAAEILLENQLPLLSKEYALFAIEYAKCHEEAYALFQKLMSYSPDVSYVASLSRRINSKFFDYIYITNASFPTPYEDKEYCIPKDILYSIVRQESLFYQYAVGHTNDYGLMQLLPSTAQEVASKILKIKYESDQLLSNADYNLELGSHYFKKILDASGSYIVAIASYNAGPYRVKGWIKDNGDPAIFQDAYKVIDWIEMIPFDGTRTYTQRVIENMHVYRSILNQRQNKPYYVNLIV